MYNLIQFVKKYHFILLFLIIEGFSVFLLATNNHYQGNKINTSTFLCREKAAMAAEPVSPEVAPKTAIFLLSF